MGSMLRLLLTPRDEEEEAIVLWSLGLKGKKTRKRKDRLTQLNLN